jgi:hypothetical protein
MLLWNIGRLDALRLVFVFAGLVFTLSGCASEPAKSLTADQLKSCQVGDDEMRAAVLDRLKNGPPSNPPQTSFNVLTLSGGTANGAWGAGWICGWSDSGKRPTFDIVTGISTGALQATPAFLGTSEDSVLKTCYTTVTTGDIYRDRFFLFLPFSDSLEETWPLAKFIKQNITDDVIKAVAAVGTTEHRKLLVATVDLRTGNLLIWDLTIIAQFAQTDPVYADLYRGVLRASAAVPVFFPPVRIGGDLQVDGGTGALVFYKGGLVHRLNNIKAHLSDGTEQIATTRPAMGDRLRKMKFNLYTIVNGTLSQDESDTCDWILSVGFRSLDSVTRASNLSSLQLVEANASQGYKCHVAFIPDTPAPGDPAVPQLKDSKQFVPAEMSKLFEAGRAYGLKYGSADGDKWMQIPPEDN